MTELTWHFPDRPEEALELMREGFTPHAGGTWLMKNKPKKGFVDLGGLKDLYRFDEEKGMIEAGALLTFSALMEKLPPDHVLFKALSVAASTTLRNRITLGGSLASFPVWSDLAAPLVLLGAEALTLGAAKEAWPIAEYLKDTSPRRGSLVTALRFPAASEPAGYFRQVRTTFDYPAFTIAAMRGREGIRAVVGGTKERFTLYENPAVATPEIPGRFGSSSEYLSHCAAVELRRLTDSLKEDEA